VWKLREIWVCSAGAPLLWIGSVFVGLLVWINLRWERGTRYYEVSLHQDLWGDWVLTQVWGRRGTQLGRIVHNPCASYKEGCERLAAVQARREQRGYKVLGK
jgi:hypothetical protein